MSTTIEYDQLDEASQATIDSIIQKHKVSKDEIMKEFSKLYNEGFIAAAPSEEMRQDMASKLLYTNWFNRAKQKEQNFILVGKDHPRKFKNSAPFQRIFVYDFNEENKEKQLKVVQVTEDAMDYLEEMTIGEFYRDMKIAEQDNGGLLMDERTEVPEGVNYFGEAEGAPETLEQFLMDNLKIKSIKMIDFKNARSLSKKNTINASGGRKMDIVDNTDWRGMFGLIVNRVDERDVGNGLGLKRYRMTVTDSTVREELYTKSGVVVPTQFTLWVDEENKYPPKSMINAWGIFELMKFDTEDPENPKKKVTVRRFQGTAFHVQPLMVPPQD